MDWAIIISRCSLFNKYWWKNLSLSEIDIEKEWMSDAIYNGIFQGKVEEISVTDKYKS
jgi:predicted DNA-binding protein YlxM (UPF0122 family)